MSIKLLTHLSLLAGLLLTACQQSDAEQQPPVATQIGFETEVTTRGVPILQTTLQTFGVYGYYTGTKPWQEAGSTTTPNKMHNVKVNRDAQDAAKWNYATQVAWADMDGNPVGLGYFFHFFGYAPHLGDGAANNFGITLNTTPTSQGAPTLTYTQPDEVANQIDLLVANPVTDRMNIGRKVFMKFKHALSQILFSAVIADAAAGKTYQLTALSLNFHTDGGSIFRTAHLNLSTGVWSNLDTPFPDGNIMVIPLQKTTLSDTFQQISSDIYCPFLLPQEVAGGAITLSITVARYTSSGTSDGSIDIINTPLPATLWESGKVYNYRYTVNYATKNLSLQDVVVKDWTVSSGGSFDIQ